MPKRQHYGQSNDDEDLSQAPQSSKRARPADSDDEDEAPQTQTRPRRGDKGKGKGKARVNDSDDSDEGMDTHADQAEEVGEEDEEFDRIHGPSLQRRLHKNRGKLGSIAEHGVIEYVEMTQFMCHKFLKFTFGPQINFIIGHNGSGKSAVLSAITVALGGKTASTGRGSGLKSFIREGQNVAEVTIHIKNQGDEAYKPDAYGETIVITRRFNKDGNSSWKIRGKDTKVISTKKDELDAICDHMNIQVDNPMNVLTQDAARQFLSASKPEDKYKFFLRGTQLEQLSQEYDVCWENINQTEKLLVVKNEALPDLQERLRVVTARWEEADKARQQQEKVHELTKELAWAHVAAKEEEMTKKLNDVAKAERRLPKIEDKLNDARTNFDRASEQVSTLEQEVLTSDTEARLNQKKAELQNEIRANKTKLLELNNDLKQMNSTVATLNKQIEGIEKAKLVESQKMAVNTQAKRDETQAKIAAAKTTISGFEALLSELSIRRRNVGLEADQLREDGKEPERKMAECERVLKDNDECIAAARQRENDAYIPYGKNMKQLLDQIRKVQWKGDMPLGPFGLYVTAKDPETWGKILRSQLANFLISFGVTDARDGPVLKRMLVQSGNRDNNIIVYYKDMFDYRNGEPPAHLLTVLRALDITDPYVLRILINQRSVESLILAPTRKEGEDILKSLRSGIAWTLDEMSVKVFPEGGVASGRLTIRPSAGSSQLLTGRDAAADIRYFLEQKDQATKDYQAAWSFCEDLKKQFGAKKREIETIDRDEQTVQQKLRQERMRLSALQQEANAELPAGLAGFEEAKLEAENERQLVLRQVEAVMINKAAVDTAQQKLQNDLNEVKSDISDYEDRKAAITKKIEDAVEVRMTAQNEKKHYEAKLAAEKELVEKAQEAAKVVEEEFKTWTAGAEQVAPGRFHKPRNHEVVQRNLDSLKKALTERAKTTGASIETLAKQVNTAKEDLAKARSELKAMVRLNKALKDSLLSRLDRWHLFRKHVALRCKHIFQYHLSQRGYYGKLFFKHEAGTLNLRVQTDDQTQTQGARDKDPKSLSGGEKSFSTICLLLSLWECIGCPLRCLDEFDVFMDAVNRRISMKMMIDTANTSDRKQYILITPQDMTNITITPSVRVLRMSDPERGTNGTLPFTSSAA